MDESITKDAADYDGGRGTELVAWMAWRVRRVVAALLSGAAREVREARYGRGAR